MALLLRRCQKQEMMTPSRPNKKTKLSDRDKRNMDVDNLGIKGLSNKYFWMKVNTGTKMRNVLGHALKLFPQQYDCVIWTGAGHAIGKVISCVELFKRKNPGLHQVTKLRYINCERDDKNSEKKQQIPQINIVLSKEALNVAESGYQRACDVGIFQKSSIDSDILQKSKSGQVIGNMSAMSSTVAEEFASMGLRTSQKRSRRSQAGNFPISKKSKNIEDKPTELC